MKKSVKRKKKRRVLSKLGLLFILCFVLSCIITFVFCMLSSPKIELEEKKITLLVGEKFEEPEYKGYVKNKEVTNKVKKSGKVNEKKLGTYVLEYKLKYSIFEDKEKVVVKVVDKEKPVIELVGGEDISICPDQKYKELGYKASDNYDGDITSKVKVIKKDNKVIYKVSDSSSNSFEIVRKYKFEDKEEPKITLEGDSYLYLYIGDSYNELGYKAIDNCDGDVTSKVEVSGKVDTSNSGTYTITYKVKDNSGNEASATRTVKVSVRSLIRPQGGGSGRGIVYLTFDDGPNEGTTNVILDVLKEEGIEATFFVTCHGPDYLIKRMHDEGHTVALHTASHDYATVYSSDANYFADLARVSNRVERLTGEKSMIVRFPGGSSNTVSKKYSSGIMTRLTQEVVRRGYHYFDWNVDSNDAAGASSSGVYSNFVNGISLNRENVVLMHDVKATTRDAIRNVIQYGKKNGYTFRKITYGTAMVTHGVNN